jgi:hypothetical protein
MCKKLRNGSQVECKILCLAISISMLWKRQWRRSSLKE